MPYYHPNFDVRKKFCEVYLPDPAEEVYDIVDRFHEVVDDVIMPLRRDLDGGFGHDQELADVAIAKAMQAVYDFGWPMAILPEELGGPGGVMDSTVTYAMLIEELGRADAGIALDVSLLYWFYSPVSILAAVAVRSTELRFCNPSALLTHRQSQQPLACSMGARD